ncbi:Cellulose synthase-like protein E6 [Acorus calamus]|uniref:Cellulose synthase-like protein E6 n=1 Tax=Acorus calamus TaxID=4465 RepID=A0AAV9FMQ8_ACOCL|nr:Cellulose synthase-like protein E6 [Acorus calamus]
MTTTTTSTHLFTTRSAPLRYLYKLYFFTFLSLTLSLLYYRFTHHLPYSHHPYLLLLLTLSELHFSLTWLLQQAFRWSPTFHSPNPDRLPEDLPCVDVLVCTADAAREPPAMVADTLLSLMAYEYGPERLAFYLSDDGASELTFHAVALAAEFARMWVPFCRRFGVEPRAPKAYFAAEEGGGGGGEGMEFRRVWGEVKKLYEDMQEEIAYAGSTWTVPEETRKTHKGFREWDSKVDPRDHDTILEILLKGNGKDRDVEGNPMPTLIYVSREKRPGHPHHYKAGALNAMNRVSALVNNAPFVLNVDCDMYSNNSQALRHAMCFFLDPEQGHRIGYVQFPQSFGGLTKNDLYANGVKRIYEIEFFGTNAFNGPMYAGTGSVHRRESLNGRKFTLDYRPRLEDMKQGMGSGNVNWDELEAKAKVVTSCNYELGKPWGKEMGLMYGCAVEDVFTGLVLHTRGWRSVYCGPEREAYLGMAPANVNDTLVQHKRWSTGLLQIFLSDYCPWTRGLGKLKMGQIMCYSFYTLWALWCMPMLVMLCFLPWLWLMGFPCFLRSLFLCFRSMVRSLRIPRHRLARLQSDRADWAKGTIKMWWNETRMWMMKGTSSYLFSIIVVVLKSLGISEAGFEITSKVIDEEAMKRYQREVMEFGVASPMFVPLTTLSLLNLYCFLIAISKAVKEGLGVYDGLALQIMISGYITLVSMPLYEALFFRKDKGRMPTSVTVVSVGLAFSLLFLFQFLVM